MLFRFLLQNNRILFCMGKKSSCEEAAFLENWTTLVWHVYSSPWSDQPSLHLDNSHLKKCFQYYPTIMFSFNQISHSYQGMLHKFNNKFFKDDYTQSKECYMHTVYIYIYMFKQCLIVLGFKDAHSSNYNMFQEESCLHQRVLFSKYGSLSWKNITLWHYAFRKKYVQLWRTYFTGLHIPCSSFKKTYCEKGIACARGFSFDIEVD